MTATYILAAWFLYLAARPPVTRRDELFTILCLLVGPILLVIAEIQK